MGGASTKNSLKSKLGSLPTETKQTSSANHHTTFLLADQGYDVWVGNMRGNSYCRSHVNMTIYDPKFWQYSFHEGGTKDLPVMLSYILNYTRQKDLYYIGHSMGTTSLFALLSSKPEYNMKLKVAICLGPAAFILFIQMIPMSIRIS
ncbi:PREDICTED: lipase 3-like, partial [Vollenhovia emeryi]|uniref:lipase 3-like n=1 Tax=Vollenhovia emeryi TaxID=411798 RepID=UPI0005F4F051